jgi:hypothetical protein
VDESITLGLEFLGRGGDVSDLELDAGLRDRDVGLWVPETRFGVLTCWFSWSADPGSRSSETRVALWVPKTRPA